MPDGEVTCHSLRSPRPLLRRYKPLNGIFAAPAWAWDARLPAAATKRRSPYHLHAFCIAPSRARVAVVRERPWPAPGPSPGGLGPLTNDFIVACAKPEFLAQSSTTYPEDWRFRIIIIRTREGWEERGCAMEIERDLIDLQQYVEEHQRRIEHLRARIERSTRELRIHQMIRGLAENSQLAEAMRSLADMTGVESATSSEVREFLAKRSVIVPPELDVRVQGTGDDFSVVATNRDAWFSAELSWSSREGFNGRIIDYSRRAARTTPVKDS